MTPKPPAPPAEFAPLIDWARWHHDHGEVIGGYWITPLRPGEKKAYQLGWSKKPLKDRDVVERHWQQNPDDNIGLVPRPGHFWLDADNLDILATLEAKHGELPRTYSQRSINGSLHYLLQGDLAGSPQVSFDGVRLGEIRGALSGQCVGAGSRGTTREGVPGNWKIEVLAPSSPAPQWVLDAAQRWRKAKPRSNNKSRNASISEPLQHYGDPIAWDREQAERLVDLVRRGKLIKKYKGPFLEGERDNLTFQVFAEAKSRMVHPDVMLATVLEAGIDGGLDVEEAGTIRKKMCSVYYRNKNQDGYGSKVGAYWFPNHVFKVHVDGKPVDRPPADPVEWKAANPDKLPKAFPGDPEPKPDVTSELPQGVTRAFFYLDMLDAIPEPTWIIDGILPEDGYILAYGKRSTKKSFTALDMGLSLATGTPYHGHDVKRGRVVYFAGEGSRGSPKRVRAWFEARKLNLEDYAQDFALVPFTPKWDTARGRDLVRGVLSEIAKDGLISLVIIDTARRAMSGDENAPTSVGQFLDGVNDICREFSCGNLIVHHEGKDPSKGARGGGPFEDDADTVLRFTKGAGGTVHMICTKQKDDEAYWKMTFRPDVLTLGSEPNGKPITSLALALESETKAEVDDNPAPSDREHYAAYDGIAIQILEGLQDPSAKRGDLALAVMGEMAPEMREDDSNAFKKALRAYSAHLTRLSKKHALWPFIDQKNDKGEALTFRNPKNRGRRAAKPSRHRTLNYIPFSQEGDN